MTIDVTRLYEDLIEHFGTSPFGFRTGVLGFLQTAYECGNYQKIVDIAIEEGFELGNYLVEVE